jgi:hypothetical protein
MTFGMFLGSDGIVSTTKLISFVGYALFVFVSAWTAIYNPDKFNYELFAILSAASSSSIRVLDKWINVKAAAESALALKESEAKRG